MVQPQDTYGNANGCSGKKAGMAVSHSCFFVEQDLMGRIFLSDKVGELRCFFDGQAVLRLTQRDGFHQKRHVSCQGAHSLQAFRILGSLTRHSAVDTIPVSAGRHGHAADGEILIQLVEGGGTAAPAGNGYTCANLMVLSNLVL